MQVMMIVFAAMLQQHLCSLRSVPLYQVFIRFISSLAIRKCTGYGFKLDFILTSRIFSKPTAYTCRFPVKFPRAEELAHYKVVQLPAVYIPPACRLHPTSNIPVRVCPRWAYAKNECLSQTSRQNEDGPASSRKPITGRTPQI